MRWSGRWIGALLAAGLMLWALLAWSGPLFGVDLGYLGVMVLVAVAALALHAASRLQVPQVEHAISPGEWRAWIGVGFMLVALFYFGTNLQAMRAVDAPQAVHFNGIARKLVMLLVAWAILSQWLVSRWKDRVQADERDRIIEGEAASWGQGALVFSVAALAVMFGFSPAHRLQWATPLMIAHLLVFALMWGWLVEYVASAVMYWRDRH